MSRTYIAGPMTGYPQSNYPAFHAAAAALRTFGAIVENPAENEPPPCRTWLGFMRLALRQLSYCDAVAMLPGWIWSRGARIEWLLAKLLGLRVTSLQTALAEAERQHYARLEALEREHFGDPDKQTGIYAPRHPLADEEMA